MARVLVSENAKNNVALQDLSSVLREITEDKQQWIYQYCERKKLGEAIYKDFIHYNKAVMGQNDSFMFSADLREEGILSLTQAFQVIAMTLENFDLEQVQDCGPEAKEQVLRLLDKLFDMVIMDNGNFRFDATPYLRDTTHFEEENCKYAYIDSITWVVSALLSTFRLHIKDICPLDAVRMDKAIRVYKKCLAYLLDSYIPGDEKAGKFTCGWNYTTGCSTPSLYFTFAVSEIMIDILGTFENVIRSADVDLVQAGIDEALSRVADPEEIAQKKEQVAQAYKKERENAQSDKLEFTRERELFHELNEGYGVYDEKSIYARLENAVKKAANNIWNLVKGGIANDFYAGNLITKVSEAVIEQSVQSDAFFNTIFIINTVVNAGIDEDAEDLINYFTCNGSQEYEDAIVEFDGIRDSLRIAYDNVYQAYVKLEKKKKAYKVNEYTLAFDEDFKGREDQVKELRKAHIRVFSLMPLLVKTKTTLGEFVIRYPQYDMQIYLENILNYRCVRKKYGMEDDYYWTWERDGYSSSSNYYFVSALNDFYNYYETYELAVSDNAVKNEQAKASIRKDYLKELENPGGEIHSLNLAVKERQAQIQALQTDLSELEQKYAQLRQNYENDPLRKALNDFVCTVVREHILSMGSIGGLLSELSDSLTASAKERVARKAESATNLGKSDVSPNQKWYNTPVQSQDPEMQALESGLRKFGISLLSERLLEMLFEDKRNRKFVEEEYEETAQKAAQDIDQAIRYYVAPLTEGLNSDYTTTEGYKGLPQMIANENAKKQRKN